MKISRGGAVIFRNGRGGHQLMYHVQEALEMMMEEERKEFVGSLMSSRNASEGQRGSRGDRGRGRGGRVGQASQANKQPPTGDSMQM